jgi:hypothetical protein
MPNSRQGSQAVLMEYAYFMLTLSQVSKEVEEDARKVEADEW